MLIFLELEPKWFKTKSMLPNKVCTYVTINKERLDGGDSLRPESTGIQSGSGQRGRGVLIEFNHLFFKSSPTAILSE